jgi:serpin B
VTPNKIASLEDLSSRSDELTDFALRLFKASADGNQNILISPLSVLCAIAMTANGADGQTREQIEATIGMSVEELNLYLYSYLNSLPSEKKYTLHLANSLWITDDTSLTVEKNFLQANADYYGASVYKAQFDDPQTVKDINNWVNKETDGTIPSILDEIPDEAIMYIVNALAFDAEWKNSYEKDQIKAGIFTNEDGSTQSVEMMHSTEGKYIKDNNATGFIKYYSGGKYAFVAILPEEGLSVSEYINTLDGATLGTLLSNAKRTDVEVAIPKFSTEYEVEMSDILIDMGMRDAFDPDCADFSRLGHTTDGNIVIDRVLHKTELEVGEKGTKAGAATVVEMVNKMSLPHVSEQVYLNRPFVYMLVDCENNIPFFIGEVNNLAD